MARLPNKPGDGGTLYVKLPKSWSWRLKAACLLLRLVSWILGCHYVEEKADD